MKRFSTFAVLVTVAILASSCTGKGGGSQIADLPSVLPPSDGSTPPVNTPPPLTIEQMKVQEVEQLKAEIPESYDLTADEYAALKDVMGDVPADLKLLTKKEEEEEQAGGAQ